MADNLGLPERQIPVLEAGLEGVQRAVEGAHKRRPWEARLDGCRPLLVAELAQTLSEQLGDHSGRHEEREEQPSQEPLLLALSESAQQGPEV